MPDRLATRSAQPGPRVPGRRDRVEALLLDERVAGEPEDPLSYLVALDL